MRPGSRSQALVVPLLLVAALGRTLVGHAASSQEAAPSPPPAPQASPSPQPSPPASPAPGVAAAPQASPSPEASPSPGATPVPGASPTPPPLPRIIRVVCTDRICGNCDGKCHKESGHVAVDKKGHCACTPTEGGALDQAIRQSYLKNPPK